VIEPFESPVCRMTIVSDPDGNSIAIHKRHPQ
jgi:predicted enzyme related to lactoylglutathione lyase